ncbi:hypothetical protein KP509_37G007300 [Ceratopteris richardii]|nr:hypothetical protein KP509_37G007300 [Ceratopteris richardii]
MQILADSKVTATALQVRVVDGNLLRYSGGLPTQTVATMVSNQWVHLNVIHDADSKSIQIFVNDVLAHEELTNTYKNHYFKYGAAYTSNTSSPCIEVLWKNVAIWKKSTQINSEAIVAGGTASCFPQ